MPILALLAFTTFPNTISPSKSLAVAYHGEEESSVNELVNFKSNKTICVLKNLHGFPHENHGGVSAIYSKSEDWAVVIHEGKWQPQGLALVATRNGQQRDVLGIVFADSARNIKRRSKNDSYAYDVTGAKFSGNQLTFSTVCEIPKNDTAPIYYFLETYRLSRSKKSIAMTHIKSQALKDQPDYSWPESE